MARIIDITEKMNFEENPKLIIKGEEYEVNADALAMIKVMQIIGNETPGASEIMGAYEAVFPENERKRLEKLGLKFIDFTVLIKEAVGLVTGEVSDRGE